MDLKTHIPNFITCLNLICGCLGIVFLFQYELVFASYLIWLAAIFDFFDGFFARVLKAYSPMGKELDSLADMISFGVLPALIMYSLLGQSTTNELLPFSALLIAVFSALRLAKFNLDVRQTESFIGLPTPANALFVSSLPIILALDEGWLTPYLQNAGTLLVITIVFSLLLVVELPLFSLKFRNYSWADNKNRYIFLVLSILLLLTIKVIAIPLIIILYILISLIENKILK